MNTCTKLGWAVWILVTAWLVYQNQTWGSYDIFTAFSIGSTAVIEIFAKYFDSRWNSPLGEPLGGNKK